MSQICHSGEFRNPTEVSAEPGNSMNWTPALVGATNSPVFSLGRFQMSYQVSVFLENKLGHLEKVTGILREAAINIRSIHLNHTAHGWGVLTLVVSDPELALRALNEGGMSAALREIAVVEMPDNPGGLDELLKKVVRAGVNFTNAYGRVLHDGSRALFMIDIQDIPDARQKLVDIGLSIVSDEREYQDQGGL